MKDVVPFIKNSTDFVREIDDLVKKHNLDYLDAIVFYCEKRNIEVESVASMVKNNAIMRSKIQEEAESLNFLPKSSKLPI